MSKETDLEDKGFGQGFAAAIGTLVRTHDQPGIAVDIICSNGLSLENFKGTPAYDMAVIRKLFAESPRLNTKLQRRAIWQRRAAQQ